MQGVHGGRQPLAQDVAESGLLRVVGEALFVPGGDARVGLGEHHFQHVHHPLEERPALGHVAHRSEILGVVEGGFQGRAGAQPGGQHQADLGPGEYPGDGAQGFNAAAGFAARRAAAQGQAAELGFRGDGAQVADQRRVFADHLAVAGHGDVGELLHLRAPLGVRFAGRHQGGFQGGGHVLLQVVDRHRGAAVFEADHFALFGDADAPRHRARRLRQQRHAGGRAAPGNGAAAAVEQGQRHAVFLEGFGERFLGTELGPGGAQKAGVLGGIRITDHHFLTVDDPLLVERNVEQRRHGVAGVVQVVQGFKQRYHPHRPAHAGDLLQQHHRQHVGGGLGHGDHVGAQAFRALLGDHLAGFQHLADVAVAQVAAVEGLVHQRPAALQLGEQKALFLALVPFAVAAQAQVAGDGVQGGGVAGGFLTDIQAQQRDAETVEAPQGVLELAVGDRAQAHRAQGAVQQ